MNKAMNLCYYEFLGDLALVNREIDEYRSIDADRIFEFADRIFRTENSSTLIYRAR